MVGRTDTATVVRGGVRDVFAIYDDNILPSLIRNTDDFPSTGIPASVIKSC